VASYIGRRRSNNNRAAIVCHLLVTAMAIPVTLVPACWPVCTENLIRIDCVTESPNVNGDDRAALLLPDPVRLAVQVEEPTWGRERGAPSSTDCAAAQGARSRPAHKWGSLVLGPAVSIVSIGAQGHHYHPTGDPGALASGRLSPLLALEIPVCTENSDADVVVMQSTEEGV